MRPLARTEVACVTKGDVGHGPIGVARRDLSLGAIVVRLHVAPVPAAVAATLLNPILR